MQKHTTVNKTFLFHDLIDLNNFLTGLHLFASAELCPMHCQTSFSSLEFLNLYFKRFTANCDKSSIMQSVCLGFDI